MRCVIGFIQRRHHGNPNPEATMACTAHTVRPQRRLVLATAAAALLGALLPTGAPATSPRPFIEQVGTLDRFPADARAALGNAFVPEWSSVESDRSRFDQKNISGTAIAIPEVRQLWQLHPHPNTSAGKTGVVVRNLDTLRIERTLVLDGWLTRAALQGGDWAHAVDTVGGRLFLLGCSCPTSRPNVVFEVDLHTFAVKSRPVLGSLDPANFNFVGTILPGGMTYDPYEDDLLLLYGGPANSGVVNSNAFLYRLDVGAQPQTRADPANLYKLRSCTGPIASTDAADDTYDWEILATRSYLYVPCMRAGHTVIVVRMTRPEGNSPTHPEDFVAGPVSGETVLADQGSGRLFAVALTGQEIWAFEAATMAFTGVVATGPAGTTDATAYGLDRTTGRVFFQSPHFGLGVVEGRFFPLPQARTISRRALGQERILSDAVTGRLFVLEGWGVGIGGNPPNKPRAYNVYRLDTAPAPPIAPDPDRNTADIDEKEGVSEARFNASASGYGTRILLARGVAAVPPAPTLGSVAPTADASKPLFEGRCGFTDRDLFAGRVARAEYDTGSTAALSIAADVDGATRQDLNQPSRCQLGTLGENPSRWAYTPAACSSSAGHMHHEDAGGTGALGAAPGTANVACPAPGGALEAAATTALTRMAAVEADRSKTTTTAQRVPGATGVKAVAESVAQGVSIDVPGLGGVTIEEIRSTATSESNGRPRRKNMSTHDISIRHVRVAGQELCGACEPVELEAQLNTLAGSRAVFRTGHGPNSGRDNTLVGGSPRGAQTAVQKSVARQSSDRALVGDFTTEIPALEVTVFNDNASWGRARQIYQFAGVASSATYNVVLRPTGLGNLADPGRGPSAEPSLADIGNTPFAGLPEDPVVGDVALGSTAPSAEVRDGGVRRAGGVAEMLRAVDRGLRLFLTSPRTALLLLTAWALLGFPAVLSRRRRLLDGIRLS